MGVIAEMYDGADSIDDLDVLRPGRMPILFEGVYSPATLETLPREFGFGYGRRLEFVLREQQAALTERPELWPGQVRLAATGPREMQRWLCVKSEQTSGM